MAVNSVPRPEDFDSSATVSFVSPSKAGDWIVHHRVVPVPYTKVENEHLDIAMDERKHFYARVLLYLLYPRSPQRHPDSPVVKATVSVGAIASHYGVSEITVKRAMKHLTERGYLRVRRRKVGRVEFVYDYHCWRTPTMNPAWVKGQHAPRDLTSPTD